MRGRYVRPSLHDDTRLRIAGGRHPVVERMLDEPFIPNDTTLDTDENQLLIVTGPNMAGKSTALRRGFPAAESWWHRGTAGAPLDGAAGRVERLTRFPREVVVVGR